MATITCFGGAHVDRKAFAHTAVTLGSSNPVTVQPGYGGVARNVAETLARLGHTVSLVARVGEDAAGTSLLGALDGLGIDVSQMTRSSTSPTGTYTAFLVPDGRLFVGMADMAIHDELLPDVVAAAADTHSDSDFWFLDANLPPETLRYLASHQGSTAQVAADGVSLAKVQRLRSALSGIDVLFVNQEEAAALGSRSATPPHESAARLRDLGVGAVIVAMGDQGVLLSTEGIEQAFPALPAKVSDVTGAGDALAAGVLHGLSSQRAWAEAIALGLAAAALTIEGPTSVRTDISDDLLTARLAQSEIT